jgi:hypothetical protein
VDKKEYVNARPSGWTNYADRRRSVGAAIRNSANGGFQGRKMV